MSKIQVAGGRVGGQWRLFCLAFACMTVLCTISNSGLAQESSVERKLVTRVEPDYPETLKRLYIGGVVKVEAVVTPTGLVESTQLLGGSPVLGQSAMKAIKRWKYAPASAKEKVVVQLEFDPHR